jgi:hypothetical protein
MDNGVLYFCGTYVYDLLKEKVTINKNVYCHFTMGACLIINTCFYRKALTLQKPYI